MTAQISPLRSAPAVYILIFAIALVMLLLLPRASRANPIEIQKRFDAKDLDKDGRVSFEEYIFECRDHFQRMDLNKDGYLTLADLDQAGLRFVLLRGLSSITVREKEKIINK